MADISIKDVLGSVAAGGTLSEAEAADVFEIMMSGEATAAQIGALLMGMRLRGETVTEIAGGVRVMRAKALKIDAPEGAIDTVGTGGDAAGTYNVSTAVAFVVAATGVPVAKHGNRALSSKSGAADVLTELGVNVDCDMALVQKALWDTGICFMMAPRHHGAMRHVGPARVEMGIRTIFNLLGPLSNPAGVKRQLTGVFAKEWVEPMALVLANLGSERAWIVHGHDGLDEITTTGPTWVAELNKGQVKTFEISPEDAGLPRATINDLKGGDPAANALALNAVLDGHQGAYRDIVLLNAAGALIVAGKVADLKKGVAMGAAVIDDGGARKVLQNLIDVTNQRPPM
jgi:anthranilate phosphoribosyltransferase